MGRKSLVLLRFCQIVGQNMGQTLKTLASNRFWCGEIPNRNTVRVTELVCGSSGSKTGTKIFCVCAHKRYRLMHPIHKDALLSYQPINHPVASFAASFGSP